MRSSIIESASSSRPLGSSSASSPESRERVHRVAAVADHERRRVNVAALGAVRRERPKNRPCRTARARRRVLADRVEQHVGPGGSRRVGSARAPRWTTLMAGSPKVSATISGVNASRCPAARCRGPASRAPCRARARGRGRDFERRVGAERRPASRPGPRRDGRSAPTTWPAKAGIEYARMSRGRSEAPWPSRSSVTTRWPRAASAFASGRCISWASRSPCKQDDGPLAGAERRVGEAVAVVHEGGHDPLEPSSDRERRRSGVRFSAHGQAAPHPRRSGRRDHRRRPRHRPRDRPALVRQGMKVAIGDLDLEAAQHDGGASSAAARSRARSTSPTATRSTRFLDEAEAQLGAARRPHQQRRDHAARARSSTRTTRRPSGWSTSTSTACCYGMKVALPRMLRRGRGHIVNIASTAGKGGYAGRGDLLRHEALRRRPERGACAASCAARGDRGLAASCPVVVKTELGRGPAADARRQARRARGRRRRDRRGAASCRASTSSCRDRSARSTGASALLPRRGREAHRPRAEGRPRARRASTTTPRRGLRAARRALRAGPGAGGDERQPASRRPRRLRRSAGAGGAGGSAGQARSAGRRRAAAAARRAPRLGCAGHVDVAAVLAGDVAHDGQAEAGPRVRAGVALQAAKRSKTSLRSAWGRPARLRRPPRSAPSRPGAAGPRGRRRPAGRGGRRCRAGCAPRSGRGRRRRRRAGRRLLHVDADRHAAAAGDDGHGLRLLAHEHPEVGGRVVGAADAPCAHRSSEQRVEVGPQRADLRLDAGHVLLERPEARPGHPRAQRETTAIGTLSSCAASASSSSSRTGAPWTARATSCMVFTPRRARPRPHAPPGAPASCVARTSRGRAPPAEGDVRARPPDGRPHPPAHSRPIPGASARQHGAASSDPVEVALGTGRPPHPLAPGGRPRPASPATAARRRRPAGRLDRSSFIPTTPPFAVSCAVRRETPHHGASQNRRWG